MKQIIILTLVFSCYINYGQEYSPIDFENGIWVQNEGLYGEQPISYLHQYYSTGDTLINGISYFKLMKYSIYTENGPNYGSVVFDDYYCAIRNTENREVELIFRNSENPVIIYDFNLTVGDTIKNGYGSIYHDDIQVISIDSILYCGKYFKRFNLNDSEFTPQSLIEGIGSSAGLIEPYFDQFEQESELVCYKERNNNDCDDCELILSNPKIEYQALVDIYPNPGSGSFLIKSNQIIREVKLFNILGNIVYQSDMVHNKEFTYSYKVNSGLYVLQIYFEQNFSQSYKIIITD